MASVEEAWVSAADLGNEEIMEWLASEAQVPFLVRIAPHRFATRPAYKPCPPAAGRHCVR